MKGIVTLAHVAIKVSDIERSLAFYRDGLEFPELFRLHRDGKLWIVYLKVTDTCFVELFPEADQDHAPAYGSNGIDHYCFAVDSLEAVVARLVANKIPVGNWITRKDGPELVMDAKNAIVMGADNNRQAWLRDPDGNRIELLEMIPNNLQEQALARLRNGTQVNPTIIDV